MRYYAQAIGGGARVLLARRPIERLAERSTVTEERRRQFRLVLELRAFASDPLALPDNRSYRSYVDLGRRAAVWNVVAAPEFSVEPKRWCFLVVGCVSYRGYFSEAAARRYAERLRERGWDVAVEEVIAYSTLGWFADPVFSTFIDLPAPELAALLFHELAHQVVYVPSDTVFNESFATVVESEGVRRWLAHSRSENQLVGWLERLEIERQWTGAALETRSRLAELYRSGLPAEATRAKKQALLAELDHRHRGSRPGAAPRPLNNAHLASVEAYYELVPALQALLRREGGDLAAFYRRVRELAELPVAERRSRLAAP